MLAKVTVAESLARVTLASATVTLVPLELHHVDDLFAAASIDRSTYGFTPVPDTRAAMAAHVGRLLDGHAAGENLPFAIADAASGALLGQTMLFTFRSFPRHPSPTALEIGGTWLAAPAQRTGVNTAAKRLLLGHAFDTLGAQRVELRTDARNARSHAAILRIGAQFEGVLRAWQPSFVPGEETMLRDSAMFSILAAEWPRVRAHLDALLERR